MFMCEKLKNKKKKTKKKKKKKKKKRRIATYSSTGVPNLFKSIIKQRYMSMEDS